MDKESPTRALLVVTVTALVCSILVSAAAVYLQPIQKAYADFDRIRTIVQLSGLTAGSTDLSDLDIISAYRGVALRLVDLESGRFDERLDAEAFVGRLAADELQQTAPVPPELDSARLGNRPRWMTIYVSESSSVPRRLIFPIYGQGMWSTIHGYLALDADYNTIADVVFYDLAETAGIGDRITRPDWLARWKGKQLYDQQGQLRFNIGTTSAASEAADQIHGVDGIAGATVTVNGVAGLVRYWFGSHGYGPLLARLATERLP